MQSGCDETSVSRSAGKSISTLDSRARAHSFLASTHRSCADAEPLRGRHNCSPVGCASIASTRSRNRAMDLKAKVRDPPRQGQGQGQRQAKLKRGRTRRTSQRPRSAAARTRRAQAAHEEDVEAPNAGR